MAQKGGTCPPIGKETKHVKNFITSKLDTIPVDAFYSSNIHARK
jgi:hypothetical protein